MSPLKEAGHAVIVEFSVKEFQDGAQVNSAAIHMAGDQDYTALVLRLMTALHPAATPPTEGPA